MRRTFAIALGVFALLNSLAGQTPTGTLQGTVQDSTRGAVPGAKISIVNQATNETRELVTDSAGRYIQPFLLAGTYSVTASKEGFRPVREENVKLDVGQNRSVDLAIQVGAVVQAVDVVAAAPPLDLNTSSVAQVIENKRIMDLPLNGRSAFGLASLTPGVNPTGGGSTPRMSGGRNGTSELQIDGVTDIGPDDNPGISSSYYEPQVDAVEEFSVQINALSAEYGRFGGGVINVATKSGTNKLHGTAYDFLRNSTLDANNFFANRAGQGKGSFKRNQWGGTVGGPIVLPKLYNGRDKSFFFIGFEATQPRSRSIFTGTVPIDSWRQGNFSNLRNASGAPVTIYDPLTVKDNQGKWTRSPFPGNVIPSGRIDPVAARVARYWPQANVAPANPNTNINNFTNAGSSVNDSYRLDSRVDQNWTSKWRMFARFAIGWSSNQPINFFGNEANSSNAAINSKKYRSLAMDHTYTLSPSSVLNIRYGLGRSLNTNTPFTDGFDSSTLGFPKSMTEAAARNGLEFPRFDFAGAAAPLGTGGWTRVRAGSTTNTLTAAMTKLKSNHMFKFGGEYRKMLLNLVKFGYPSGYFTFSPGWTQQDISAASNTAGSPLASFLLGLTSGGNMSHDPAPAVASAYYGVYAQDDWKVTRRLTLNLGLRYDVDRPRTERYNRLSYYDLHAPSPIAGKAPSSACPACGNLLGSMNFASPENPRQSPTDWNNIGPRVGFAWNFSKNMALRGGYGIAYAPTSMQPGGASGNIGLDGSRTTTAVSSSYDSMRTVNSYLQNPFPNGYNFPLGKAGGAATQMGFGIFESIFESYKTTYVQQWNLNMQRQLPGHMVAEIGYLGSRGIGLIDGGGVSYNELTPNYMSYGPALLQVVPNPFYGIITDATSALSKPTVEWRQLQRPYPQMANLSGSRTPYGSSKYHAMTLRVDKRFSRGLSLLFSYTAGKLMDDTSAEVNFLGPQGSGKLTTYNRRLDWAVDAADVSQRMVVSYVYELPVGKGKRFLSKAPKLVEAIAGQWQINGITSLMTGTPLAIAVAQNNTYIYSGQRANSTGGKARITGDRSTDQKLAQWFDTSVFTQPGAYTFGTVGRTIPDARTPGNNMTDLSLFKSFFLTKEQRIKLQYRLEAFSAFNKPQWNDPGMGMGSNTYGVISGAGGARQLQMALKLIW
jgi:hypothetical protein